MGRCFFGLLGTLSPFWSFSSLSLFSLAQKKQPVTPLSFRRAQRGEISQWHPLTRSLPAVETTGGERLLMVGGAGLEGTFPRSSVGAISRQRARGAFWYGALLFWFVGHVKSVSVVRSAVPVQSCPKKQPVTPLSFRRAQRGEISQWHPLTRSLPAVRRQEGSGCLWLAALAAARCITGCPPADRGFAERATDASGPFTNN